MKILEDGTKHCLEDILIWQVYVLELQGYTRKVISFCLTLVICFFFFSKGKVKQITKAKILEATSVP